MYKFNLFLPFCYKMYKIYINIVNNNKFYYGVELNKNGLWMISIVYIKNIYNKNAPNEEFKITKIPPNISTAAVTYTIVFECNFIDYGD